MSKQKIYWPSSPTFSDKANSYYSSVNVGGIELKLDDFVIIQDANER
jgi:hypothetical protein